MLLSIQKHRLLIILLSIPDPVSEQLPSALSYEISQVNWEGRLIKILIVIVTMNMDCVMCNVPGQSSGAVRCSHMSAFLRGGE